MLCKHARQEIEDISDLGSARAGLTQHLLQCDRCRNVFAERRWLQDAMARVRVETTDAGPSLCTEQHIFAALDGRRSRPVTKANTAWRWFVVGAFASVILFTVVFRMMTRHEAVAPSTQASEAPFTAMPYVIPPAPYERTSVIRTEVPLQIMLSAGFQVEGDDPSATALADVLYGEDGRILALRLVTEPNDSSTTRMD